MGIKDGAWEESYTDGRKFKGNYVEGERHGRWLLDSKLDHGSKFEGEFDKGKKQGQWVVTFMKNNKIVKLKAEFEQDKRESKTWEEVTTTGQQQGGGPGGP